MESACFDSTESAFDVDVFHDCASFATPSIFGTIMTYLAYPVLGFPVLFAHAFHQLRCFQLICMVNISSLFQMLATGLLFVTTVWWDTLLIIVVSAHATPALPCHMLRRHKRSSCVDFLVDE